MSAPSAKTTTFTSKLRQALRFLRSWIVSVLPPKRVGFLVGLFLLICGQMLVESLTHQGADWTGLWAWSRKHHIDIVNLENTLQGGLLLLAGSLLCAWLTPREWNQPPPSLSRSHSTRQGRKGYSLRLVLLAGLYLLLLPPLTKHQYTPLLPMLWLFTLTAAASLFWKQDQEAGNRHSPRVTSSDLGWILILLAFGLAVGAFLLEDLPAQLIPDEGSFWETASAIARGEHRPPIWGAGVYTFPIATSHWQGWILRIFGVNLWGWRFSSVLAAVLSTIPLYLLLQEWFERRIAITACLLLLSNPYFLAFARLGYNNAQTLLPVTLSIYLAALAIRKSSAFYYFLSGVSSGLAAYTYPAAWIAPIALVISGIWLSLSKQKTLQEAMKAGMFFLGGLLAVVLPQIVYTLSSSTSHALTFKVFETSFFSAFYARAIFTDAHPELITTLVGKNEIVLSTQLWGELLLRGAIRTLVALFNPHLIGEHFMTTGLTGGWMGMFSLVGLFIAFRRSKDQRFAIPPIWFIVGIILLGILAAFPPRHTHLVAILPAIAILSSLGFCSLTDSLGSLPKSAGKRFSKQLNAVGLFVLIIIGLHQYFVVMPDKYRPTFEDIVSWNAWRQKDPMVIYYIEEEPGIHKVEYLTNRKLSKDEYINLSYDSLQTGNGLMTSLHPALIFYPQDDEGRITKSIISAEAGFRPPIEYKDVSGNVIGYGATNVPGLELQPDYSFVRGIESLVHKPVIYVLVALLLALAVIGWRRLQSKPAKAFEFEFKIRIAFSSSGKVEDKRENKEPK